MGGYYKEGVVRVVLCVVVLLVEKSGAYEFVVGGQKGWSVPSDPNFNPYNAWAEKSRFQIGDSLGQFLAQFSFINFISFFLPALL